MASATKQTQKIRNRKLKRRGADRKKKLANKGTTPVFPIHKDGKGSTPAKG